MWGRPTLRGHTSLRGENVRDRSGLSDGFSLRRGKLQTERVREKQRLLGLLRKRELFFNPRNVPAAQTVSGSFHTSHPSRLAHHGSKAPIETDSDGRGRPS
jgi:hypothetical protein